MKFTSVSDFDQSAQIWIVFSAKGGGKEGGKGTLSASVDSLDKIAGGVVKATLASNPDFNGKHGQTLDISTLVDGKAQRIVVVGTGEKINPVKARELGGTLHRLLTKGGDTTVAVDGMMIDGVGNDTLTESFAEGLRLKQYHFDKYKSKKTLKTITDMSVTVSDVQASTARLTAFTAVADGVDLTRNLTSEPANMLFPATFADEMKKLTALGIEVDILGEKDLHQLGMNAMLGVGQGSPKETKMVVMRYNGGKDGDTPLVLVGKGVCFDTGGISIKPSAGMEEMKWDMGGAGIVAGTMKAIAGRKANANVHAFLGLTENMPDGDAQRPGDVVTTMAGKTVEVVNTDAEGRLVLADVLTYAQKVTKPEYVIDVATLTGAIIIALGHEMAGMFSNDDDFANALYTSGQTTGDKVWRLPVGEEYNSHIDCLVADMKNVGKGRSAGSISAAKFIEQYVEKGVKWIHLDVAAMVWENAGKPLSPKGATGYGVRLLNDYIAKNFEK